MKKLIAHCSLFKSKEGQSLVEILIAVGIGGLVIGAATYAISFILSSNTTNQQRQIAISLGEGLINHVRSIADANWLDIYNLPTKGATSTYFVVASSSELIMVEGKEGMLSDDVIGGLVGYWKFDEATGTTAYDSSGNQNNGTLTNGPTRATSTCKVSYCLNFDGVNDYVNVGNGISLNFGTGNFTLEAWVKTSSNSRQTVLSRYNGGSAGWEFKVDQSKTYFFARNSSGVTVAEFYGTIIVADGNWHYILARRSGTSYCLYVDGVSDKCVSGNADNLDNTRNVWIGQVVDVQYNQPFNGLIDDVRIYNRALSDEEIKRLYNSKVFTRSVAVENVQRDASDNIVTAGGTDDPSTQKITATVEWLTNVGSSTFQIVDYVTRWKNRAFNQSDWSGGAGQEGPLTEPNNKYASSTNIDVTSTPGVIKLKLPL